MQGDGCVVCGGDGSINNAFGNRTTCPGCHGSGRRSEDTGFHDVTKTKPSHHRAPAKADPSKPRWPTTLEGAQLATDVRDSKGFSEELKAKLIGEILDYEDLHGRCTQTFVKKIRKQVRPRV